MAPYLSWRQARIIELLSRATGMTSNVLQTHMDDPMGNPPQASIRRDIGVLRSKGYTINYDPQTWLYSLMGRPASDTTAPPVTTPDDVYANV